MGKEGTKQKVVEILKEKAPWIERSLGFLTYHGSRAYGTNVETSDTDIKGYFVPGLEIISDPFSSYEQVGSHDSEYDVLVFDVRKLLKLAAGGNPGIAELLWIGEEDWIYSSPGWATIHDHRDMFLTKLMCRRFIGYTIGELKVLKKGLTGGVGPASVRRELYDAYGYDTKAASHSVRVSRMCKELAIHGTVQVRRPDAEELIRIRRGQCEVYDLIDEVEQNLLEATSGLKSNTLPEEVDNEVIKKLSHKLMTQHLYGES